MLFGRPWSMKNDRCMARLRKGWKNVVGGGIKLAPTKVVLLIWLG